MQQKFNSFKSLVYSTDPNAIPDQEPEEDPTPAPGQQHLKVSLDNKKRRGKTVTLIEGFVGSEKDLNELCKQLKTKCGAGGSAKDKAIIIQGDFKLKITEWLKEWGYKVK